MTGNDRLGITPVTNPTSTTVFKALIALKTRNPVIFAFHPSAQECSVAAATAVRDPAVAAGAPEHCIQWITEPSLDATAALMRHDGVATILATGGAGMVRAAYSAGKPALGVGPGNVPAYIESSAGLRRAVNDIVLSKSFDNGMVCASEQAVIVDAAVHDEVLTEFTRLHAHLATPQEKHLLEELLFGTGALNAGVVGHSFSLVSGSAGPTSATSARMIEVSCGTSNPAIRATSCAVRSSITDTATGKKYPLADYALTPTVAIIDPVLAADLPAVVTRPQGT